LVGPLRRGDEIIPREAISRRNKNGICELSPRSIQLLRDCKLLGTGKKLLECGTAAKTAFNCGNLSHILRKRQAGPAGLLSPFSRVGSLRMPAKDDPVVIKKYANRRLYNTGTSTYVTLEDLAQMVKRNEDFVVHDAKTGDDITHSVLTQIIFELENDKNGQNMLPISFLRQLISFYGDQMQMVLPSFLEQSILAFSKEQERLREQMQQTFGASPMDMLSMNIPMKLIEEQTRRNMEMFQNAMRMFTPPAPRAANGVRRDHDESSGGSSNSDDLKELREQIAAMQRKLDAMSKD